MSNCLIAYQNRADEATLSNGYWTATLPLSNLKDRILSNPARSADLALSSTMFDVMLASARTVQVLALCAHNITTGASFRIRGFSDAYSTAVYDSGWQDVWPSMYNTYDLEWKDDNWWGGHILGEDMAGYSWNLVHRLPSAVAAQYWRVEINDSGNVAGFVQIGRLFCAAAWVPVVNMLYGASLNYEPRTDVVEAYDGTEYFDERPAYRTSVFTLGGMLLDEAMVSALDMQRINNISEEVLFVWDQADTIHAIRRSFLGRLRKLNPIEQFQQSAFRNAMEIKELL